MATFSELVRGFRCNVREGIPTILSFDGAHVKLNCSPSLNGYVGLATREGKVVYEICDLKLPCSLCTNFPTSPNIPDDKPLCKLGLVKPAI